jgi:GNAT superfamily N-acetyltransferase
VIVRALVAADRPALADLVSRTDNFRPEEKAVALEVADAGLLDPRDYRLLGAFDIDGTLLAWVAFGEVPMTKGTFDLYWIASDPRRRRGGAGRALVRAMEDALRREGARMVVVETEEGPGYDAAVRFYAAEGYPLAARIADFYRPGAAKLVFVKRLEL